MNGRDAVIRDDERQVYRRPGAASPSGRRTDDDVSLVPNDERASNEAAGVEPTRGDRQGEATHPDVGDLA